MPPCICTILERSRIRLRQLQQSISSYGQIAPALVVADEGDKFMLIDGYLRLNALKGCGYDCIYVQVLEDAEVTALFTLLVQDNAHHYEAIEQASLINELHSRFSCSFTEIAKRLGRGNLMSYCRHQEVCTWFHIQSITVRWKGQVAQNTSPEGFNLSSIRLTTFFLRLPSDLTSR